MDVVLEAARFLPLITVLAAIFVARAQLRAARKATATTIAKTHYRKMLALFLKNTDILFAGITSESLKTLMNDQSRYLRYRILFTNMVFACQEMFLAVDTKKDKHWANALKTFVLLFRSFIRSDAFMPMMQEALHPQFLAFVKRVAAEEEHPIVRHLWPLSDHAGLVAPRALGTPDGAD